jgi:hypothetical protein
MRTSSNCAPGLLLLLLAACSSASNDDSTGPTGEASTCAVVSLDAGFTTVAQLCGVAPASSPPLQQDACGPYLIVTRGTSTAEQWYFDADTGALVAVVTSGVCTTSQSSFASQWGTEAWGCATSTPACSGGSDAGAGDGAAHD